MNCLCDPSGCMPSKGVQLFTSWKSPSDMLLHRNPNSKCPTHCAPEEVGAYLQKELPEGKTINARPPLDVKPTTMVPLIQQEQYMAVRLYFNGKEYARWVRQDAEGRKPFLA